MHFLDPMARWGQNKRGTTQIHSYRFKIFLRDFYLIQQSVICIVLGVKIRNLKFDFKTGGTWRQVGQGTLIMNIYNFFLFNLVV